MIGEEQCGNLKCLNNSFEHANIGGTRFLTLGATVRCSSTRAREPWHSSSWASAHDQFLAQQQQHGPALFAGARVIHRAPPPKPSCPETPDKIRKRFVSLPLEKVPLPLKKEKEKVYLSFLVLFFRTQLFNPDLSFT